MVLNFERGHVIHIYLRGDCREIKQIEWNWCFENMLPFQHDPTAAAGVSVFFWRFVVKLHQKI